MAQNMGRARVAVCLLAGLLAACSGSSTAIMPTTPLPQDFSINVNPNAVGVELGSTSTAATIGVAGQNGFSGSVLVEIQGLPAGVVALPAGPLTISAGAEQAVTFNVHLDAPVGRFPLTVRGSSGALVHTATLTLKIDPEVTVLQEGTRLVLRTRTAEETVRVGLETQWGGSVVEVSLNGLEFVNRHDTGREVQVAEYDGNAQYDNCAGCTGVFGWDPVQAGDKYGHGSAVLEQIIGEDSIFIRSQPLHWNPDDKGGGPLDGVAGDIIVEQTLTTVPGFPRAFQLHYKLTHGSGEAHANTQQEFPAVYVNLGFDRLVFYEGTAAFTGGAVTLLDITTLPPDGLTFAFNSEHWTSYVNADDVGLTVYVPAQHSYLLSARHFPLPGPTGPEGDGTNYFTPFTTYSWQADNVLEGDIFLIAGDYQTARAIVYELHASLLTPDIFAPFGGVDEPVANSTLSGAASISGWAFEEGGVARVDVFVDGSFVGMATYGVLRPDVAAAVPHAPEAVGFRFNLDTTQYVNGAHIIEVTATDQAGNVAVYPRVPVTILN